MAEDKMASNNQLRDLGNIAILVVDIQNDFCHDKGVFAKQGLNVNPAQLVTPRIKSFIAEVRKYGLPIVYSKQIESDEMSPDNLRKQFASGKLVPVCAPDSWGSELYELEPADGEHVLVKHTYDLFSNPELTRILKDHEIATVVITGVNTDVCIDTTVRRAFTEGYNVVVPEDLVATMNAEAPPHYLPVFDRFFGTVTDSSKILTYLEQTRSETK